MSSSVEKSSGTPSLLTGQNIVYAGIAWAVLSLLFFLLFSANAPGQERPLWYMIGTYLLELFPFLVAALLCYRNWRSPQIASGRNVWLGIGLGMTSYFLAGLLFGWWELFWGLDPDVSPADFFYLIVYLCVGWGMVLAVLPRRLNLETWQWATVAVIAVVGIALAVLLSIKTSDTTQKTDVAAVPTKTEKATSGAASKASAGLKAPAVKGTSSDEATASDTDESNQKEVPPWTLALENTLSPLATPVNLTYIIGDVFLLIIASTLLLAFWGGRFAQSWRMIAAATFALYIADMWTKYAAAVEVQYESGGLLEVFYVFSGVLFAIGAALEYDVSIRSRRGGRKRA
ncbi:MAG TPA: hypothetical protein V6D43_19100 [Candidatus Sericytochromatia bacterium]